MSWNIILVLVCVGLGAIFGLFRGAKNASLRLLTVTLSIAISIGLAVALQYLAKDFQFLAMFDTENGAVVSGASVIKSLIPFADNIVPVLNKMFFASHCSLIVAFIFFLLLNKLGKLFYHMLAGIGHTTDKLMIQQKQKKITFTGGVVSTIFGTVIGAIQGLLVAAFIFAPMAEIASFFII